MTASAWADLCAGVFLLGVAFVAAFVAAGGRIRCGRKDSGRISDSWPGFDRAANVRRLDEARRR